MKKIRVGVVGVGYLGQFHAEKYASMEGVELAGVVDIDAPRAKEIAKRCRVQPFFHHSHLFGKVQAVSIAVPTLLHYPITKDFFLQGIDVLLEKPISQTLEEADELIELAESKGLIFQVGHLERFNGALSALQGMVQSPLYIEAHRLSPFPGRGTDVNVVLDVMIHDIDILLSLVNSKVREIDAVGIPILTPHSDIANARIEFENGCRANVTASRVSKEKIRRTRIFLPNGTLSIDYLIQKVSFSKRVDDPIKHKIPEIVTEEIPVTKVDSLEAEIHSFLQSVRDRKRVRVSGWDGKRALEVALQIIQKIDRLNKERT
ncbi:MAG: Gfo/Idh/MocA family oxidoreductase [Desulfobacterales bacterium]|nr:Gfo/Idh/MocA family oxidoreductase [Desulfobacterales bacterium]